MNKRHSCAERGGTIQEPDNGRTEVASPAESWLFAFVSLINFDGNFSGLCIAKRPKHRTVKGELPGR